MFRKDYEIRMVVIFEIFIIAFPTHTPLVWVGGHTHHRQEVSISRPAYSTDVSTLTTKKKYRVTYVR